MNDIIRLEYTVDGDNFSSAGVASSEVKRTLKQLGFPSAAIKRVSICMYEGEINMVIHANGGRAEVLISPARIEIALRDSGPGIPDVEKAMQEGYSTASEYARDMGFGAGMGLPNMKKYSDEMRVETTLGKGTSVYMTVVV